MTKEQAFDYLQESDRFYQAFQKFDDRCSKTVQKEAIKGFLQMLN